MEGMVNWTGRKLRARAAGWMRSSAMQVFYFQSQYRQVSKRVMSLPQSTNHTVQTAVFQFPCSWAQPHRCPGISCGAGWRRQILAEAYCLFKNKVYQALLCTLHLLTQPHSLSVSPSLPLCPCITLSLTHCTLSIQLCFLPTLAHLPSLRSVFLL